MKELRDEKLDFWIKNNLNVLLCSRHGVGKSTRIMERWNHHNLKWKYFSASTTDVWTDFVGIPRPNKDEKGEYLDFVLPKDFRDDNVEAIFMDEFNRAASPKILNSVMELLQFKSINGRKFKNLRMIWAAINPKEDNDYNVEELDKAIADRFHVHFVLPNEPSKEYFTLKYGEKLAEAMISWWFDLPSETKIKISPRRLEYAAQMYNLKGDLRDVLPEESNISKLLLTINHGPISNKIFSIFENRNEQEASDFLKSENNYLASIAIILKNKSQDWMEFWLNNMPKEKISLLITKNERILDFAIDKYNQEPYNSILDSILEAKQNYKIIYKINKKIKNDENKTYTGNLRNILIKLSCTNNYTKPHFSPNSDIFYTSKIASLTKIYSTSSTACRTKIYESIEKYIPEHMSISNAENTLKILMDIVVKARPKTLINWKNLVGIINHCIISIQDNFALNSFLNTNTYNQLFLHIKKANLHNFIYVPKGL